MIVSLGDKRTEDLFHARFTARLRSLPPELHRTALRKLDIVNAASSLVDLSSPPSNHLERLKGDLAGRYSIRINDQWRLAFRFEHSNAYEVEIVDYH